MSQVHEELDRLWNDMIKLEEKLKEELENFLKGINVNEFWDKNDKYVAAHKKWQDYLHKHASEILAKVQNKN